MYLIIKIELLQSYKKCIHSIFTYNKATTKPAIPAQDLREASVNMHWIGMLVFRSSLHSFAKESSPTSSCLCIKQFTITKSNFHICHSSKFSSFSFTEKEKSQKKLSIKLFLLYDSASFSGYSAAWLARLVWDQKVGGSNPSTPKHLAIPTFD